MPEVADQVFLATNAAFIAAAFLLTVVMLILASRHVWRTGYGSEQHRLRVWTSLVLIILTLIAVAAIIFNLVFI